MLAISPLLIVAAAVLVLGILVGAIALFRQGKRVWAVVLVVVPVLLVVCVVLLGFLRGITSLFS